MMPRCSTPYLASGVAGGVASACMAGGMASGMASGVVNAVLGRRRGRRLRRTPNRTVAHPYGMPINPKLVRVSLLLDPIEGRAEDAWVIQYHGQTFLTDKGGGNAEPFAWNDQAHQPVVGFEVKTQEDLAGDLRVNPALLGFMRRSDPTFPPPILSFREGPIWDAEAVERWIPTRQSVGARDGSRPRS